MRTLAEHGEERTAEAGETLFSVGEKRYPLIAIIEGEAMIVDPNGSEIVRTGASGFLGEMNLLTGQTLFLGAVATEPMRYIAVEREAVRELLTEDSSLADLLLSTFIARREILQRRQGIGVEIVGPRSSEETRDTVDWARRARLPHTWLDPAGIPRSANWSESLEPGQTPLVRLPGGVDLHQPS